MKILRTHRDVFHQNMLTLTVAQCKRKCVYRAVCWEGGIFFRPDLDEIARLTPSPDFNAGFENIALENDGRQSAPAGPSVP